MSINVSGSLTCFGDVRLAVETNSAISVPSSGDDIHRVSDVNLGDIPKPQDETQFTENQMAPSGPVYVESLVVDEGMAVVEGFASDDQPQGPSTSSEPERDDLKVHPEPEPSDVMLQHAHMAPEETVSRNEELVEKEDECRQQGVKYEFEISKEDILNEREAKDEFEDAAKGKDDGCVKVDKEEGSGNVIKDLVDKTVEIKSELCDICKDDVSIDPEHGFLYPSGSVGSGTELTGRNGLCVEELTKPSEHTVDLTETKTSPTVEERGIFLIEQGRALLQCLNILAGDSLGKVPAPARLAIETETRISDWKVLLSLGIIPEPYFSHMQTQLKQLESVLTIEESSAAAHLENPKGCQFDRRTTAPFEETSLSGGAQHDNVRDWSLNWAVYHEQRDLGAESGKPDQLAGTFGNGSDVEEGEICISRKAFHVCYAGLPKGVAEEEFARDSTNLGVREMVSDGGCGGGDVDMEVDMEVDNEAEDEPAVPGVSTGMSHPSFETSLPVTNPYLLPSLISAVTLAPLDPLPPGESGQLFPVLTTSQVWAPPLPPEDEWAPPPPIDSETIPAPPPEEPPPLPPQSPRSLLPYNMPSVTPVNPAEYYAPEYASEYISAPDYMPVPEYQPVVDTSFYGMYVEEAPGTSYSNNTLGRETVGLEAYSIPQDSSLAFNDWPAPGLPVAPSPPVPLLAAGHSVQNSESSPLAPAVPSPSAAPYVPAASTTTETSVTAASLEAKKLAKAKTGKKRTHSVTVAPMLMTNKKVSSLVSKWKQAKEELHGSDEEEDDKALYDIEVLERKKQKEIEEWRRQQIASGDALDNANFQPLGTLDWRERVKRAKKTDGKEGEIHMESSLSVAQREEPAKYPKPDLIELSKGLPTGWQAFWDETSGEVYYGNLSTQQTSWDRPVI